MKLIILNGASCSGKSTIIKNIKKQQKELFHLSYDSLKWSFSDYKSNKYQKDVQKIILAVAECVFKMKYNVIFDSALYKTQRKKLINSAKNSNYEIIEINLEASFKILSSRFNERINSTMKNSDRKIANVSKKRFKELFDTFNKEKSPRAITFQTDEQSAEEISRNIIKLFKLNS